MAVKRSWGLSEDEPRWTPQPEPEIDSSAQRDPGLCPSRKLRTSDTANVLKYQESKIIEASP